MNLRPAILNGLKARATARALTLLEMMVSITLLAVIMVGLLTMFNQTQKALHVVSQQTDVFENARAGLQTLGRDFAEVAAIPDTNVVYFRGEIMTNWLLSLPPLPGVSMTWQTQGMMFVESFALTRVNDQWNGIGYYVAGATYGVGTLYRFSYSTNLDQAGVLHSFFTNPPPNTVHRISDGVVHFLVRPTYVKGLDVNGRVLYSNEVTHAFYTNDLPAYIDIELGILESTTLKQFHSLTDNVTAAQNFLVNHAGNIHFFRERVPIRNFVNPYRSNEVP